MNENNLVNSRVVLAVDIGGTNIKTALIDSEYNILKESKQKTPSTYKELIEYISSLYSNDIEALSIAIPGGYNYDKNIIFAPNLTILNGKNILNDLKDTFKYIPILIENDANLAALGEYHYVEKASIDNMILLTLGTGVGGGVIINGKLHKSRTSTFEIGHTISVDNGRKCGCGRYGCLDEYANLSSITLTYNELSGTEANLSPTKIATLFDEGDIIAKDTFYTYSKYLAKAITDLINIFVPNKVKIGGGLSELSTYYLKDTIAIVDNDTFPLYKGITTVEVASLKNKAGVIGAAINYFKSS